VLVSCDLKGDAVTATPAGPEFDLYGETVITDQLLGVPSPPQPL
jgi:hypothetical protein